MPDPTVETPVDAPLDLGHCCVVTYGHPLTRWLIGDSFHPGGLASTTRLAGMMGAAPSRRVLDAGSGIGATAVHLARTVGCRVTGVTLERSGVEIGYELARDHGVEGRVAFLEGSITDVELEEGSFDHALIECVLSLVGAKGPVLARIFRLLRPGGRLGLTDVTVDGELPPEMHGVLAAVGCLRGAVSLQDYGDLLGDAGFVVERSEDRAADAASFLRALRGKLLMVRLVSGMGKSGLGKLSIDAGLLDEGERLLNLAEEQVRRGTLSYGLLVARKPS